MENKMVSSIKIRAFNEEKGTAVVRFSWNSLTWKKLKLITINLFGEYIFESSNAWEQDRTFRIHELKLNEWIPVVTEMKEKEEE